MKIHVSWSVFDPENTSATHIGATGWVGRITAMVIIHRPPGPWGASLQERQIYERSPPIQQPAIEAGLVSESGDTRTFGLVNSHLIEKSNFSLV